MSEMDFCPGGDYAGCPRRSTKEAPKGKCERCGFAFDQEHLTPASVEAAREAARSVIARNENEERKAGEVLLPKQGDAVPTTPTSLDKDVPLIAELGEKKPGSGREKLPSNGSTQGPTKRPKWFSGIVALGIAVIAAWAYQEQESRAEEKYIALRQAKEESEQRALQLQQEKANAERMAAELAEARRQSDRLKEEQEKMRQLFERNAAERVEEERVGASAQQRAEHKVVEEVVVGKSPFDALNCKTAVSKVGEIDKRNSKELVCYFISANRNFRSMIQDGIICSGAGLESYGDMMNPFPLYNSVISSVENASVGGVSSLLYRLKIISIKNHDLAGYGNTSVELNNGRLVYKSNGKQISGSDKLLIGTSRPPKSESSDLCIWLD